MKIFPRLSTSVYKEGSAKWPWALPIEESALEECLLGSANLPLGRATIVLEEGKSPYYALKYPRLT